MGSKQLGLFVEIGVDQSGKDQSSARRPAKKPKPAIYQPNARFVVADPVSVVVRWFEDYESESDIPPTMWELACRADPIHSGNPRMSNGDVYDLIKEVLEDSETKKPFSKTGKRADIYTNLVGETWKLIESNN